MLRWALLVVSLIAFAAATQIGSPGWLGLALLVGLGCFIAAALSFIAARVGSVQQGQGHRELGLLMTAQRVARPGVATGATAPAGGGLAQAKPHPEVPAASAAARLASAEPGVVPRFGPRPERAAGPSASTAPRAAAAEPGVVPRFGPRPVPATPAPRAGATAPLRGAATAANGDPAAAGSRASPAPGGRAAASAAPPSSRGPERAS